jgi:hypothetical protein
MSLVSAHAEMIREIWAAVARAAADHRRIVDAGDEVFHGDLSLRRTGEARAGGELMQAIRRALDVGVAEGELVDALMSGDPSCDFTKALDLLEAPGRRDDAMQRLTEKIVRDLFGDEELMRCAPERREEWCTGRRPVRALITPAIAMLRSI